MRQCPLHQEEVRLRAGAPASHRGAHHGLPDGVQAAVLQRAQAGLQDGALLLPAPAGLGLPHLRQRRPDLQLWLSRRLLRPLRPASCRDVRGLQAAERADVHQDDPEVQHGQRAGVPAGAC